MVVLVGVEGREGVIMVELKVAVAVDGWSEASRRTSKSKQHN